MIDKKSSLYIAGSSGLIGSALVRKYKKAGFSNLITRSHSELDLLDQRAVEGFFHEEKPEYVIVAAGKIGGIKANIDYPAEYIYENLTIQNNIIWSAFKHNVKKLLYISCGCAYPTHSKQPIKEEYLLTGIPEPTNEGFALAKIAGIKLCEKINKEYGRAFISCIPANSYGEGDAFNEDKSHVISALIKKFHEAKIKQFPSVTLWGTGAAKREFIYVDDLANGIFFLMEEYSEPDVINIGSGEEVSIRQLAGEIAKIVDFRGKILFDTSKPDGMLRRFLDSSKIKKLGFKSSVSLSQGLLKTYDYYRNYIYSS